MPRLTRIRAAALSVVVASVLAGTIGGTARAASSCGVITAGGHPFIVIASGMSCSAAGTIVRRLAGQTAAVHLGTSVKVAHPPAGFVCVLQNRAKPAGSCNAGPTKVVTWLVAA
jgi:hypothetical protein